MSETLRISGKRFSLPAADPRWKLSLRPGGWIIAEGPDGSRRRLSYWEARGKVSASVAGRALYGELSSDRKHGAGEGHGGGDADLVAQFPGRVRKLLVEVGCAVAVGDPLILVEAMKMEFTVKAPFAGVVERVLVKEGQQISPGDRFLELIEGEDAGEGNHG